MEWQIIKSVGTPWVLYKDKAWKKLEVGRLRLEPGDERLVIEVWEKTGGVVMQLKAVVLTKVD